MDAEFFLDTLSQQRFFADQIVHVQTLVERPAIYRETAEDLHPEVTRALKAVGIRHLYAHQAAAIDHVRQGHSVAIVTGTASGKTLCYVIPVAEALLEDPLATMLFVYPTKALAQDQLRGLEEDEVVRHIGTSWYWASSEYPAARVNLRNIAGPVYTIQDEAAGQRIIGTMDEISAMSQLHDHAVYLHGADTYFVDRLDLDQKIAFVQRRDLDYYTQAVTASQIRIDEKEQEEGFRGGVLGYGDVTVTTAIPMVKKIRFHARDSLGFEQLELPPQLLETVALWYAPPAALVTAMKKRRLLVGEALIGLANLLVEVAPLFVMCDTQDIGTVVDAKSLGRDALFLHDRYPGGMGYALRCLERFEDLLRTMAEVVRHCGCEDGCPSCVGSAVPASAMTDLDSAVRGRIPDKQAALFLLDVLLGSV